MSKQLELQGIIDKRRENWRIDIRPDYCPENPREWSNIGKIFVSKRCRYVENESDFDFDEFTSGSMENDIKRLERAGFVVFPISVYDHSGVKFYIGGPCCRFDSGIIGFYLIDKTEVKKEYNWKRINKKRLTEIVNGELETLTAAYNGEVYNYTLYKNGEEVDSCGGFYGRNCFESMFDCMPNEFTNNFTTQEAESLANWNF